MSQKIEGNQPSNAILRNSGVGSKVSSSAGGDDASPIAAASAADSVKLTGEATNLQAIQRQLSQSPVVDAKRVDAVKNALQGGSYQVNADVIANRMLAMDSQLAG
jgi:negative regulator of flagellin synthesis FlgM